MGNYRSEQDADLIQSAVSRYMARERGSVASSGTLIDLEGAWPKISRRSRQILSRYVFDELEPPAINVEDEREEVRRLSHLGERHDALSRQIREALSVRQLGAAMNGRVHREPFMVNAGPAHRGVCSVCSLWLADVQVYRDPASNRIWCVSHGPAVA